MLKPSGQSRVPILLVQQDPFYLESNLTLMATFKRINSEPCYCLLERSCGLMEETSDLGMGVQET